MRFHLVDRVDDYVPGVSVRARKLTSQSEEYWQSSAVGPVMPPPLVLEALCQAGTWLVMITTSRRRRAALLSIGSVSFHGPVIPGDVLDIVGTVDSMSDEMAVVSGRVTVEGTPVLEASDIMCTLIEASQLEDLDATVRMQRLLTRMEPDE